MREYFLKPNSLGANLKVELDMSNNATKADFKNATGIDTSKLDKKVAENLMQINQILIN